MLRVGLVRKSFVSCLASIVLSGCSGGGQSSSGVPVLHVSSMSHDFGEVTLGNSPAAKKITLSNRGNAPLEITDIECLAAVSS